MTLPRAAAVLVAVGLAFLAGASQPSPSRLPVAVATQAVGEDADDPAIWVNRANPAASRILGTNKKSAPAGAVVVFDLAGRIVQRVEDLDRPNNLDVEYGFRLGGKTIDIAVATERYQRRLKAWRIRPDGTLEDVSSPDGLAVFVGERGERGAPMGIGLYRRPADGAVFAVVSRKQGPVSGYVWQYRLEDDGKGRVRARKVRELGGIRSGSEVEAVAVDDPLGVVYYAEEKVGIHEWAADPDSAEAGRELALFGTEGFRGDREGIAVYARPDGTGYVLCTDQLRGPSRYLVFRREGRKGAPHDHHEVVKVLEGGADATDGLDATSEALPGFPRGLVVAMNSGGRNFFYYGAAQLGLE
jgi:3-phytase